MIVHACPYIWRECQTTSPDLTAQFNVSKSVQIDRSRFDSTSGCYWRIRPQYTNANYTWIELKVNSLYHVYAYINNGTSAANAEDQVQINVYSGYSFNYSANYTLFLSAVAQDDYPDFSFQYKLYDLSYDIDNYTKVNDTNETLPDGNGTNPLLDEIEYKP